jgi:transcription initiation factor TFIID subunit 1, fungi type
VELSKKEARSFHRPDIGFPPHLMINFKHPKQFKKKNMKGKDAKVLFPKCKDLSLGDNSNVLLLEYSEEYPTTMSNFGMGSRIINYYRRKNAEDNSRPKLEVGETAVLLPQDKSPFAVFGDVPPGQQLPTLHNAMFKAPIFKQAPKPTDFLVVRNSTSADGPSYYLRNIENIYTVGQNFPSTEVPGPHSRKVTTASKNRLKMISFRKVRKNPRHRLRVDEITPHFDTESTKTSDMQIRQKMKEFMQYSKEHKEWEMKNGEAVPTEESLRSMIKPEDVCLLESMQVGLQSLKDAGFGKEGETEIDDDKEEENIHKLLAPWQTTKNFINAAAGKAMLMLHGEGDPSGRGEAFSFVKTSMKGGFRPLGESVEDSIARKNAVAAKESAKKEPGGEEKAKATRVYNVAKQQQQYDDAIQQIWNAQFKGLSATIEPDSDHEDPDDDVLDGRATVPGTPATARPGGFDDSVSMFSKLSSRSTRNQQLRIKRKFQRKNGQWEFEERKIDNPQVIAAYRKKRKELDDAAIKYFYSDPQILLTLLIT